MKDTIKVQYCWAFDIPNSYETTERCANLLFFKRTASKDQADSLSHWRAGQGDQEVYMGAVLMQGPLRCYGVLLEKI